VHDEFEKIYKIRKEEEMRGLELWDFLILDISLPDPVHPV